MAKLFSPHTPTHLIQPSDSVTHLPYLNILNIVILQIHNILNSLPLSTLTPLPSFSHHFYRGCSVMWTRQQRVACSCSITRCPGARVTRPAALSTHSVLLQSRRRQRDPRPMPRTVVLKGRHWRRDPAQNATALLPPCEVREWAPQEHPSRSESPQIAQQQRRSPA